MMVVSSIKHFRILCYQKYFEGDMIILFSQIMDFRIYFKHLLLLQFITCTVITVILCVNHLKQRQFKIKLRSLKVLFQNQVTWDCQLALASSASVDLVSLFALFKIHDFWRFHMKTHISFSIYVCWGETFFLKWLLIVLYI